MLCEPGDPFYRTTTKTERDMEENGNGIMEVSCECWHDTVNRIMYQDFGAGVVLAVYFGQGKFSVTVDDEVKTKDSIEGMSVEQFMNLQCEVQRMTDRRRA